MKKIILCCHIMGDGIGDFQHLIDIYNSIKGSRIKKDYELILVVTCVWKEILTKLEERLKKLSGANFYLSTEDKLEEKYLQDREFQAHLAEAEQFIRISSDYNVFDSKDSRFRNFINPNAIRKFIGEHERDETFSKNSVYSLGLSEATYGIKISSVPRLKYSEALDIFTENDNLFSQQLSSQINSSAAEELLSQALLVPAYFNKLLPFYRMILLLAINESLQNRNIIINASGSAIQILLQQPAGSLFIEPFLKSCPLKEVRIENFANGENLVYSINPNGNKIIHIFYGYMVSDASYQAMYQQAKFAGVSGDNTFEMAISVNALPYYHSTNASAKKQTLKALLKIIQDRIELPESIKNDFLTYFETMPAWAEILTRFNSDKQEFALMAEKLKNIDLNKMMESWGIITDYLREHYNFYHKLEAIISGSPVQNNAAITFNHPPEEPALYARHRNSFIP